jgi:large subunit ribosomal protein L10
MKIAKNTLVKVAIKKTDLELLTEHLCGPTAILYSQDPVALSKVVVDTARQNEHLKIKAGFFNKAIVNESTIRDMAKLGSIEEVRASFIGLLSAKQANFVRLLTAPEKGLAANKTN